MTDYTEGPAASTEDMEKAFEEGRQAQRNGRPVHSPYGNLLWSRRSGDMHRSFCDGVKYEKEEENDGQFEMREARLTRLEQDM